MVQREQIRNSWVLPSQRAHKGLQVNLGTVVLVQHQHAICFLVTGLPDDLTHIVFRVNSHRPNQVAEKVAARISENFSEAAMIMVLLSHLGTGV